MNKKGFVGDMLAYGIIVFVMAIVVLCCWILLKNINTAWQADANLPAESKAIMSYQATNFIPVWDGFFILMAIGYIVAIIIAAAMIRSHPVFAGLAFILLVVVGLIGVNLANSFYDIANTPSLATYSADFPKMDFIVTKLPYIIVTMGLLFIVVMYAKSRQSGVSL